MPLEHQRGELGAVAIAPENPGCHQAAADFLGL
jgi:hypothetical protein